MERFKQVRAYVVTSGNSLRQTVHTHRASVHQAEKLVAALRAWRKVKPTAGFMTHVTCRLSAKNRDQLRNPTLGNRVWATFTFFIGKVASIYIVRQKKGTNFVLCKSLLVLDRNW